MAKGRPMLHIAVDTGGVEWVQPSGLVKRYSMSRTTVYTHLEEMKAIPKYKNSFLDLSHTLKLVRLKDWDTFLHEKSRNRWRK